MRTMLKSKIHRAHITEANIDYEGSITLDKKLMEEADILPYEQVEVLDISNGARFTTYVIEGPNNSGEVCINGAAARLVYKGDTAIILSYCQIEDEQAHKLSPKLVYVDAKNAITHIKKTAQTMTI